MNIRCIEHNKMMVARVPSSSTIFQDVDAALDLLVTVRHDHGCDGMIVDASAIDARFFTLSTGLAREVLQKYVMYMMKLVIIGDFSQTTSKSLRDCIYECNQGTQVLFVSDETEALAKICIPTTKCNNSYGQIR
ncbi:MAG: DUF4180 domain-containing protein [Sphaerochaetaceae bacterium]|jgi:hypothetical protein|nr:DUF4180 domain-containing protein [Sphaerochaetaceae bacterium]NLO59661.1 DUF4180 domain-containing protein [Spirochaetales bacterium]